MTTLRRVTLTDRQRQVLRGILTKPEVWADDPVHLPRQLKSTYTSLYNKGMISVRSQKFVLTVHGKSIAESLRPVRGV